MKRILLTIFSFLLMASFSGAETWYVQDSTANSGTNICYKSGAWPAANCSDGTDSSDLNTVIAAASASDTIRITGGTFSGTQIGVDGRLDIDRAVNITNSTDAGHTGTVTLGVVADKRGMYVSGAGATISNITLSVTGAGYVYYAYITKAITLTNVSFINTDGSGLSYFLWISGAGENVSLINCTSNLDTSIPFITADAFGTLAITGGTYDAAGITTQKFIDITGGTAFSMTGATVTGPDALNTGATMISVSGVATVDIKNNVLEKSGYYTTNITNANTHLDVSGNEIRYSRYHAIYFTHTGTGDHKIYRNYIHDQYGDPVTNKSAGIRGNGTVAVYGNLIKPYGSGVDFGGANSVGSIAVNNTIIGGQFHGLAQQGGAASSKFANNIVSKLAASDSYECFSYNDATYYGASYPVLTDNNLCWIDSGTDIKIGTVVDAAGSAFSYTRTQLADWKTKLQSIDGITSIDGSGAADAYTQFADPLFVSGTYRLQSTSPAINAGTVVTGLHDQAGCTDFAGLSCVSGGGGPDIGAYERQGRAKWSSVGGKR